MNQATVNCHCPQCQQIDQVQKISAIYSTGLSNSKATGYIDTDLIGTRVQLKGESQTYLSKKFNPPEKPKATLTTGGVLGCTGTVLVLLAMLAVYSFKKNIANLFEPTLGVLACGMVFFIVIFIVWRQEKQERHVVQPTLEERLSHWQELCNVWNGTYYCHRCHIVYHPDKPDRVYSVENASQLYNFKMKS